MCHLRDGLLVVLGCHCVYDGKKDCVYADYPEDRPIFESHIVYSFNHIRWRQSENPLLVISGGYTKKIKCSESRSYLNLANKLGLEVPADVKLEEYALTSVEHLLFSLYTFKKNRKVYPKTIDIISWAFKKERFKLTLEALNNWKPLNQQWDSINFFPVGDLYGHSKEKAMKVEKEYMIGLAKGLEAYYNLKKVMEIIQLRDVYHSRKSVSDYYKLFPLPF